MALEIDTQERILRILGPEGDRRLVWRRTSLPEIQDAKVAFRDAIAKGHIAFKVGENGQKSEKILEFDSLAEEIILVPPMIGG